MKKKRSQSIIGILESTNNYLALAIALFIFTVSVAGAVILYQSHKTVCELFDSKMETTGVSIARELALGEKSVALNLFEKVVTSLKKVSSDVDLYLKEELSGNSTYACQPSITNAKIFHEISFSGDRVGIVRGEIKSFNFNIIFSFILLIIVSLFLMLKFVKNKLIQNIRNQIVNPIEQLCSQELLIQENLPDEVKKIADKLNVLRDSIALTEKAKLELSHAEKLSNISTQVAHDIRSPLEVLKSISSEIESLPNDTKRMIQLSISRIEEIAFNLLKSHRQTMVPSKYSQIEDVLSLLMSVTLEKKIQYRNRTTVTIVEKFDSSSYGLFSFIQRNTLKNIISNLINNAVESLGRNAGKIVVEVKPSGNRHVITILDNGNGISIEAQKNIFTKGFTTKSSGNGLGLYNAKQDIEAVGGTIEFESEIGKGTTFIITLPKSEAPTTYVSIIDTYKYDRIIVLDDDPAFHEVWNKRLEGLESKVEHIHSVEEMLTKYESLDSKTLLLSDFELMDKNNDGVDTILKLNHSAYSILVTARSEEKAIQDRCIKAGIKLLPKSLINYVVVKKENLESMVVDLSVPVILIDDDRLIQINWANYCNKKGLTFHGYKSIDEFIEASTAFDKSSRIYIDSNLGNGIKGEVESERIFRLGFLNLYLATGYENGSIEKPVWIKEIYSKRPDDIG